MLLSITHQTRYAYDPGATRLALRLKLFPPTTSAQIPQGWTVQVNGDEVTPLLTDGLGEDLALWHCHKDADEVVVTASGTVETKDSSGVLGNLFQAASPGVFLRRTALTKPDDALREIAQSINASEDHLARLHALSEAVHEAIDYRPSVTGSETTAADALALGAGVCQDQAHVFIAVARLLGIPARYVAGYLLDPDQEDPSEETHAWAEAHVPGLGWVGFDITNEICPTDAYVRLSTGLDASDAAPLRGTVTGTTDETMDVTIAISQATANAQQ